MALNLQALIDATPAGGTLELEAAEYDGAYIGRQLTINGNGATISDTGHVLHVSAAGTVIRNLTAQGSRDRDAACVLVDRDDVTLEDVTCLDSMQYGVRLYQANGITLRRVTIRHVATGVQVFREGDLNTFTDLVIEDVDRMRVDDGGLATNGGQGLDFYKTTGTTRITNLTVRRARAKTTGGVSWEYDGSAVEGYGPCGPVHIDGFTFEDCVNVCEVGTDPGTGVPTGWIFQNGTATGNPDPAPGWDRSCEGFYFRANNGFLIEDCEFRDLDDFVLNLVSGGSYGGEMGANAFRHNRVWLKPGPAQVYGQNRAYIVSGGVTATDFGDVTGNRVYFDPEQNPEVGLANDTGTRDVEQFRQLTGWTLEGEEWGPEEHEPEDQTLDRAIAGIAAARAALDMAERQINAHRPLDA